MYRSRPGGSDGPTELPKSRIPAFLRVIKPLGHKITRKNAWILLFGSSVEPSEPPGRLLVHTCMYRRLRGAQDGGSKVPPKKVLKIQVATANLFVDKRSPQEGPKSAQNEAKRAPKQAKEHLYIPNRGFAKIELPPRQNRGF